MYEWTLGDGSLYIRVGLHFVGESYVTSAVVVFSGGAAAAVVVRWGSVSPPPKGACVIVFPVTPTANKPLAVS